MLLYRIFKTHLKLFLFFAIFSKVYFQKFDAIFLEGGGGGNSFRALRTNRNFARTNQGNVLKKVYRTN